MAHMVQTHDGWVLRNDWFIEDVQARLEDYWDFVLTDAECVRVLELVAKAHDANDGITWGSIDSAIGALFGDRQLEDME